MPAIDYVGLVYTLLANKFTAVGSATRPIVNTFVRFDKADTNPDRIKNPGPGELRVAKVVFELDRFSPAGDAEAKTFRQCAAPVRVRLATFAAKVILDDVRITPMTAVLAAMESDLAAAPDPAAGDGKDLGIPGCNTAIQELSFDNGRTDSDPDAPDRMRRVGTLSIPVRITYQA